MTSAQILLVEDEDAVRELLAFHLSQAGFKVSEAATAEAAWEQLNGADLVVLDWMLPDESGGDVVAAATLERWRQAPPRLDADRAGERSG